MEAQRSSLVDMSGCLQHISQGHDCGIQFKHVLFNDKVLPPNFQDVGLKSRTRRSVVEETSTSAVDLEGRSEKESPGEQRIEQGLVEFMSGLVDDHRRRLRECGGVRGGGLSLTLSVLGHFTRSGGGRGVGIPCDGVFGGLA